MQISCSGVIESKGNMSEFGLFWVKMTEKDCKNCKVPCSSLKWRSRAKNWSPEEGQNWPPEGSKLTSEGVWGSLEGGLRIKTTPGRGLRGNSEAVSVAKTGLMDAPLEGEMTIFEVLGPKMSKTQMQKLQRQKNGALGRNIRSTVFWDFGRHSRL